MRLKTLYSGMILAAMLALASCNAVDMTVNTNNNNTSNVAPPVTSTAGARRITTAELDELIKKGQVYILDVRTQDAWDMGHIPGSHLIPANEVYQHVDKLPRDKMIVTYCS